MAITDINISEQLQTDAPSIKYTGNEGPQASPQHQQEQMIAQQIWEALDPEQQARFQSFEQFFQSGIWKQILQQMQADQAQGQGIGSLGPRTEQIEEVGVESLRGGGRIGFDRGTDPALMKKAQVMAEIFNISLDEAIARVISQSEGSFPRPEIRPFPIAQEPLRRSLLGRPPEPQEVEDYRDPQIGIDTLRRGRRR